MKGNAVFSRPLVFFSQNRVALDCQGFTLIEVLVAAVMLAFGLVLVVQSLGRTQQALMISRNQVTASLIGEEKLSELELELHEARKVTGGREHGEIKAAGRSFRWESEIGGYSGAGLLDETKLNKAQVTVDWQEGQTRKNRAVFAVIQRVLEKEVNSGASG